MTKWSCLDCFIHLLLTFFQHFAYEDSLWPLLGNTLSHSTSEFLPQLCCNRPTWHCGPHCGPRGKSPSTGFQNRSGRSTNKVCTVYPVPSHPSPSSASDRGVPFFQVAAWFTGANSLPTSNFPSVLQVAGIFAVTGGSEIAVCGYGHDLHSQHLQNKMIQLSHEMRRWMGVKMGEQPSTTCSLWDRWLPTFTVAISSGINIILRLPGF